MLPETTCAVYQNAFEETLNYFFSTDAEWLKDMIRSKEKLLDHPKIAHQRKILLHYSTQQESRLNIFIVGEGNFGKSTLLNAMVQGNIAPMHFLPSTWCIHRYIYGEKGALAYKGGNLIKLNIENARTLVAEEEKKSKENKAYVSDLTQIDWFYPDYPALKKFTLVDTPGIAQLRSILSDHSIEDFYYKADCVLWLLNATKINSESTLNQIKQLSRYSKKILGVINKWDAISGNSRENILRIANSTFGSYLTDIQPVSALLGLKSDKPNSENYRLSNMDELLGKIDSLFLKNARRLANIQTYHTLKQAVHEASLILNNEMSVHKKNLDLYLNNISYVRDQKEQIFRSLFDDELVRLDRSFMNKMESKIVNQLNYNSIELKLREIEADSSDYYRGISIKATEIRNRHYYRNIQYLSQKKYTFAKYNYDGTVNLLETEDSLLELNPIKIIENMKITTAADIKLRSILMEKIMPYVQEIPLLGGFLKELHENKKRKMEQDIIRQIKEQSEKNIALLRREIEEQIEENYLAIEYSFENKFNKLFTNMETLKAMLKKQEDKINLLGGKYLWATAIARKITNGERYAEAG